MEALRAVRRGILRLHALPRFSGSIRDTLALADQLERTAANRARLSESLDTSVPWNLCFSS